MSLDLNDPQVKEAIAAEVAKAVAAESEGLKAKNAELLAEKKALAAKLKAIGIDDPEEAARLKNIVEEAEEAKARAAGDFEKLKSGMEKKHAAEVKSLTDKLNAADKTVHQLVAKDGLAAEMARLNVAPEYRDAVTAMLLPKIEVTGESGGDVAAAMVEGKTLKDFMTGWAQGDQGKHFVRAKGNGGGGAPPGNGNGGEGQGKQVTRAEFDQMDMVERSKHMNSGGVVVDT